MLRIAPVTSVSHPPATPAERGSRPAGVCFARGRIRNCAQGCSFAGQREPASAQRHVGVVVKDHHGYRCTHPATPGARESLRSNSRFPKRLKLIAAFKTLSAKINVFCFSENRVLLPPFRAGMRG